LFSNVYVVVLWFTLSKILLQNEAQIVITVHFTTDFRVPVYGQ